MNTKKVIFFDFFGVICSEISPIWFKKHYDEEHAKIIKEEIMSKADLGIINEEEVYDLISSRLNIPSNQIKEEWTSLIKINDSLVNYIKELKKEYKIYLLSNAMGSFLHRILNKYNLYSLFDNIFISSEIKLAKPNTNFFYYVLEKENINKEEVIVTDDNINNVNSARSIDISSILFKNTLDFKEKINTNNYL